MPQRLLRIVLGLVGSLCLAVVSPPARGQQHATLRLPSLVIKDANGITIGPALDVVGSTILYFGEGWVPATVTDTEIRVFGDANALLYYSGPLCTGQVLIPPPSATGISAAARLRGYTYNLGPENVIWRSKEGDVPLMITPSSYWEIYGYGTCQPAPCCDEYSYSARSLVDAVELGDLDELGFTPPFSLE